MYHFSLLIEIKFKNISFLNIFLSIDHLIVLPVRFTKPVSFHHFFKYTMLSRFIFYDGPITFRFRKRQENSNQPTLILPSSLSSISRTSSESDLTFMRVYIYIHLVKKLVLVKKRNI